MSADTTKPLDGFNAIVIGAGFGGLASAIELRRRGATVQVLEASPDMRKQGDVIMMGSNATVIMKRWGDTLTELLKGASQPEKMTIADKSGKVLLNQELEADFGGNPNLYTSRALTQELMYNHAVSLGVKVVFDARVTEVFETDSSAGAFASGTKYQGDLVVAADGVHSKARAMVTGIADRPQKSGFAVFRSWFPLQQLKNNPRTQFIADSDKPFFNIWIAEDTHAILTTNLKLQRATCFVTHKDTADIKEDWNLAGDLDTMLKSVEGWDPVLVEIVKQIPRDCLVDYKLLWRDPVKEWISPKGRVALVGDAAHPHLATSGTGGAQAIEDAATIGVLLEKLGAKKDIPLGLRAYARLRYERTSLTQRMGWETRHVWHQTDWEAVAKSADVLKLPQPAWLNGCDAEKYAHDNFDAVISHVQSGTPFRSTNIPEGHIHEDWTISEMLAFEGEKVDQNFYKTRDINGK